SLSSSHRRCVYSVTKSAELTDGRKHYMRDMRVFWSKMVGKQESRRRDVLPVPDRAPLKSAPVRLRRDVVSDAVDEVDDGVGGIHPETLFAHLMKLGQDEAAAVAGVAAAASEAATKADRAASSSLPKLLSLPYAAATSAEKNALYIRESAGVRRRMRQALEDNRADPLVVASATALALRFLQRRYHYPALSFPQGAGVNNTFQQQQQQQQQSRGNQRRRQGGSRGSSLELLSTTCLHLASKYHCVDAMDLETVGSPLNSSRVFEL
ncbi:unnamed protein product, partial [Pylaiella littoralis]